MPWPQRWRRLPVGALLSLGLIGCTGGVLALSNPSLGDYQDHAGEQLVELARAELCDQAAMPMLLQLVLRDCPQLIATQRQTLATLAGRFTTRWNFGVGSLYHLSSGGQTLIPGVQLPQADVWTLGLAGQFVLLRATAEHGALE